MAATVRSPSPSGFQILYEEGPCLVVAKPGGILTQAAPGIDSLEVRVKQFLKERDRKPGNVYLATLHRLDRPVSGTLMFAKHVRAARRLAEQFEARTVQKRYWAVVAGQVEPGVGTWTDYTRKIPDVPQAEIVPQDDPMGRIAVLHYRRIAMCEGLSWLDIELETGRMHQIRLQAASRGYPVLGDALYGSAILFGPQTDDPRARCIALHARSLRFHHPMTRDIVVQTAPLPDYWSGLAWPEDS